MAQWMRLWEGTIIAELQASGGVSATDVAAARAFVEAHVKNFVRRRIEAMHSPETPAGPATPGAQGGTAAALAPAGPPTGPAGGST